MNSKRRTRKKKNHNINGTTVTLIILGVIVTAFTIAMIVLFDRYQEVPDSLIVAVFGATFGECGFCTLIYKIKKGVQTDGIHGTDISSDIEALRDSRYGEL